MSWIGKWILNRAIGVLLRQAEKAAGTKLSDQKAKKLRRYIEDRLYRLSIREQGKKWATTHVDDQVLRFAQVVMKSRWLDQRLRHQREMGHMLEPPQK